MPHGGPDWGTAGPLEAIFTIEDMAELAARLGSIVTFDRRGNVLWFDGFENSLCMWEKSGFPLASAWSVEQSAEYSKAGAFSAKLTTGVTTDDRVNMTHYVGYPFRSRNGVELAFSKSDNLKWFDLILDLYGPIVSYYAFVRYIAATETWQYYGSDERMHDLSPTMELGDWWSVFNVVKLVADFNTGEYVRLQCNAQTYDLTGIGLVEGAASYQRLRIYISAYTNTNAAAIVHVDDVILTENEP